MYDWEYNPQEVRSLLDTRKHRNEFNYVLTQTHFPVEFFGNNLIRVGGYVHERQRIACQTFIYILRQMNRTDGFITMDAADYCPTSTQAMRSWFAESGRKCYYAGPLIPRQKEDILSDPRSHQTQSFLDEKLASHGEKSVIYVCRGHMIASLKKRWF